MNAHVSAMSISLPLAAEKMDEDCCTPVSLSMEHPLLDALTDLSFFTPVLALLQTLPIHYNIFYTFTYVL